MDIRTGLSLLNKQWLIEPSAALQMLDFWERVKEGETWSYARAKSTNDNAEQSTYQIHQKFFATENVVMAPDNSWDMPDFKGFDGATIAVIPVNGPLMKSDFCGSFGTNTLRQLVQMASNTDSVTTIIFDIDSPGGTVDGTEAFATAIKESGKRTVALINGYMCSAAYWIGSSCDEVYATSQTDIIGSIGTMCSFYDNTKALSDKGIVLREYYATASKDKNKGMSEAMAGDGKRLIKERLDPLNNVFLTAVKDNRGDKIDETVLTGNTYTAAAAIENGLIDGIKTFDQVVNTTPKRTMPGATVLNSESKNINIMTPDQIKATHPESYKLIQEAAVKEERDRVGAYLEFIDTDQKAVVEGITKGEEPNKTFYAEMTRKSIDKNTLDKAKGESAPAITTTETPAKEPTAQEKKDAEFLAACEKELKLS